MDDGNLWSIPLTEAQRRYLEELVKADVDQLASDVVSAETNNRPRDALHLRLAHGEAVQILDKFTLRVRESARPGID